MKRKKKKTSFANVSIFAAAVFSIWVKIDCYILGFQHNEENVHILLRQTASSWFFYYNRAHRHTIFCSFRRDELFFLLLDTIFLLLYKRGYHWRSIYIIDWNKPKRMLWKKTTVSFMNLFIWIFIFVVSFFLYISINAILLL